MIRAVIISDTHQRLKKAEKVISKLVDLDFLIHAGDHWQDGIELGKKFQLDTFVVAGNCDPFGLGKDEEVFKIGNKNILLTHGSKYGVKNDYQRLLYRGIEAKADLIIFGHTHVPINLEVDAVKLFNPGSLELPRNNSKPSYGLLEVKEDKIYLKNIEI